MNSPLTDIFVSKQLYWWTLFSIPPFAVFPLFMVEIILVSGQLYKQALFPIPKGARLWENWLYYSATNNKLNFIAAVSGQALPQLKLNIALRKGLAQNVCCKTDQFILALKYYYSQLYNWLCHGSFRNTNMWDSSWL